MKANTLIVLTMTALLVLPIFGIGKRRLVEEVPEQPPMAEGFRPDKVKKEWRIAALNAEIDDANKRLDELKKLQKEAKEEGRENTILRLRLMLKEDFVKGLKEILAVEKGKKEMPEMMRSSAGRPERRYKKPAYEED